MVQNAYETTNVKVPLVKKLVHCFLLHYYTTCEVLSVVLYEHAG